MSSRPTPAVEGPSRGLERIGVALLAIAVACALCLPGLGAHGLWSLGELEVLDRVRAALGEPLHGLLRTPILPELLRELSARALGPSDLAIRLPGALAVVAIAGVVALEAHRIRNNWRFTTVAVGVALSMPMVLGSARTALGMPVAELCVTLGVVVGAAALRAFDAGTPRRAIVLGSLAALALSCAVASAGIFLGVTLPLLVLALGRGSAGRDDRPALALWLGVVVTASVTLALMRQQTHGYIPLLGASRELRLMDQPQARPFSATLEEVGLAAFPWFGLALVGAFAAGPRLRLAPVWLVVVVLGTSTWSMRYGATPAAVTLPLALCAARGCERLFDPAEPRAGRRLSLLIALLGVLVLSKDAQRVPARVLAPTASLEARDFPESLSVRDGVEVPVDENLRRLGHGALLLLLAAFAAAPRSRSAEDDRPLPGRRRDDGMHRLRSEAPWIMVLAGAGALAGTLHWWVAPRLDAQLSVRPPLDRWAALVDAGDAPAQLGIHRLDETAVRWYGGARAGDIETLSSRRDVFQWFDRETPAIALLPERDVPPLFSRQRLRKTPLHVLAREGRGGWLVANFLPEGMEDQNPILDVISDAPPGTGHPTLVQFHNYVRVVEWDLLGDVRRGGEVELVVTFEVLRPMPSNTQLWGRLKMDRISRINDQPQVLTQGVYPPNNWRRGDFVTHRQTFEIPRFEAFAGPHELLIGLRRNQYDNVKISVPEGARGEFGVVVQGKKREFAKIAEIAVE